MGLDETLLKQTIPIDRPSRLSHLSPFKPIPHPNVLWMGGCTPRRADKYTFAHRAHPLGGGSGRVSFLRGLAGPPLAPLSLVT